MINYNKLPEHLRSGAKLYIERGIQPGSFMTAVICDNLFDAVSAGDSVSLTNLVDIVKFWYNEAPSICWGSADKFHAWVERGGTGVIEPENVVRMRPKLRLIENIGVDE